MPTEDPTTETDIGGGWTAYGFALHRDEGFRFLLESHISREDSDAAIDEWRERITNEYGEAAGAALGTCLKNIYRHPRPKTKSEIKGRLMEQGIRHAGS